MPSAKKARAVPNPNPFGLSTREVEIMVLAWRCVDETGKLNNKDLATLATLGNGPSAGRMFRGIKAKIMEKPVVAPGTPDTAINDNGGDKAATATGAPADPESPSVLASDKKKKKRASGAGKVAGRKRTMKEAAADDGDDSVDDGDNKIKIEGGERPNKIPKHFKGKAVVTLKKLEAAESGADDDDLAGVEV